MGIVTTPHPVKLITGVIASSEDITIKVEKALQRSFGSIDYRSGIMPFDFTDYYEKDMGPNLKRCFFSFVKLISPDRLPRIKHITNRMESEFSRKIKAVRRPVNIDPGYLTDAKLILASTKDYSHRIYLGRCVYAEVTLHHQKGSFGGWGWTYPDYKSPDYIRVFNHIRSIYMQQRQKI